MKGVRLRYLDTLKVAIVYGIFVYHSALAFTWTSWLVSNPQKSLVLTAFVVFTFPWGIPMMFLLAGSDAWFALRSRSPLAFLRRRFLRLVLPLAAGVVLLSPLQAYLAGAEPRRSVRALLDSYPGFFRHMRLDWTPEWLGRYGYHLWFLGYLFAISAVLLPLLVLLKRRAGARAIAALADFCGRPGAIYVLALPLVASQLALRSRFPLYEDWADVATYSLAFLAGYVFVADGRFTAAIVRNVRLALAAGCAASTGVGALLLVASRHLPEPHSVQLVHQATFAVLWSVMIWSWMLVVLYAGVRWLDAENRVTAYLSESVLPFYLLHHPVVVLVGSMVIGLPLGVWPKFGLVVGISLATTLALYEFAVRRWEPARFLFGLKPLPAAAAEPRTSVSRQRARDMALGARQVVMGSFRVLPSRTLDPSHCATGPGIVVKERRRLPGVPAEAAPRLE